MGVSQAHSLQALVYVFPAASQPCCIPTGFPWLKLFSLHLWTLYCLAEAPSWEPSFPHKHSEHGTFFPFLFLWDTPSSTCRKPLLWKKNFLCPASCLFFFNSDLGNYVVICDHGWELKPLSAVCMTELPMLCFWLRWHWGNFGRYLQDYTLELLLYLPASSSLSPQGFGLYFKWAWQLPHSGLGGTQLTLTLASTRRHDWRHLQSLFLHMGTTVSKRTFSLCLPKLQHAACFRI